MSLRKIMIAAALLAAVLYVKLLAPELARTALPALQQALCEDTVAVRLPQTLEPWLPWS